MLAGLWQHHQVFDGTYTFEDLIDVHELLDVKAENQRILEDWRAKQQQRQNP